MFIMSDSDNDLLPSNAYTFQNESTAICAKGPNVNSTNITSLSFRNNVLTSTMNMPRNFERQRYQELSFDQRNMRYRRETSPMSMYSDTRSRNFHNSFYAGGMSSQRSMYSGRGGSPMSMRSMDSNVSVSAADIALAFKNVKFNKYDLRVIKEAYNKFMKRRVRKRIEKRRNMKLFLKGYRRKSGYDSGEQGSDSSISSDDCRSTHSAMYKDNMSSCRSTRTDITDFRRSIKESNMYRDCTNSLKNNAFKNIFSVPSSSTSMHHRLNDQTLPQNPPNLNQKERFKNGFLLPSQRFNQSIASVPIPESQKVQTKSASYNSRATANKAFSNQRNNVNDETESDQEEIFSEITVREKSFHNPESQHNTGENKRSLELEENECSGKKRPKISSPEKQKKKNVLKEDNNNEKETNNHKVVNDFEFLKPQFPVRKSSTSRFKEQLISKSAAPLTDEILPSVKTIPKESVKNQIQMEPPIVSSKNDMNSDKTIDENSETMPHSNSDMSMRPSFIKRKLFSQKMDVTERRNLSTDEALNTNSPQTNMYSAIQREKHKARKVVTNQSCLNRDIAQEDNNLLDLIHKIVPADRMNMTNVTNKTSLNSRPSQDVKNADDDKWDVTSVISMCNNDNVSDTYTDEEIFNDNRKKTKKDKQEKPKENIKVMNDCKVVLEKSQGINKMIETNDKICKPLTPKNTVEYNKKSVYNCVKSFWDTDFESDLESPGPKRWAEMKENHSKSVLQQSNKNMTQQNSTNTSVLNNTTSLSESLKYQTNNSILDNNVGKLKKYNINRNLTIKAFRTPKIKMNSKNDDYSDNTLSFESKQTKSSKIKQPSVDLKTKPSETENKKTEIKKTNLDKDNNKIQKKTQPVNSKPKISKTNKKPEVPIEIMNNNKVPEPQNKAKDKSVKSKVVDKSLQIDTSLLSTTTRSVRVPKKTSCCDNHGNKEKQTKSSEKSKENKTTNQKNSKSKTSNTANNSSIHKEHAKPVKKNKSTEKVIEHINNFDNEPVNRMLRTRKIDLSSSFNTSNENVNITIRSLRTRRINLSSSNNDSTLDGNLTVVAKKFQKTPVKKKGRSVKNNCIKG